MLVCVMFCMRWYGLAWKFRHTKNQKSEKVKKCPCYADILVFEEKFQAIKEAVWSVCRAYRFPLELKRQKRVKPWKIKQKRNENEKISLKWWNFTKYPAACPLHRRGGEHGGQRSVPGGHPLCHVLPRRLWILLIKLMETQDIVVLYITKQQNMDKTTLNWSVVEMNLL